MPAETEVRRSGGARGSSLSLTDCEKIEGQPELFSCGLKHLP